MAELVVVKGAHRGAFAKIIDGPVTIGRAKSTQLALHEDTKVSHVHARVTPLEGERFILEDLGSTNGTFVNDERIEQIPLRSGDLVRIGRSLLIFRLGGSSVHLEDVGLEGGGSSHDIRPATGRMPPRPEEPPLDETGEREALPSGEEDERTEPMEGLLLAAGAADLASGLEGLAAALLRGCAAERAIVFLRHPLTRGLGRAALRARAGQGEGLVDADALARAAGGELVVTPRVAAGPVPAPGAAPLGVVLVDAAGREPAEVGRLLTAAGAVASLLVTNDRARRLADAAIDVVALAQERVARQAIELGAQLGAVDRMHGPVARQRGLGWKVVIPSDPLFVLADPLLLGRGFDRVLEHVLTVARGDVRVAAAVAADGRVRVEVTRPRTEPADAVQRLADPEGVVADLRRAREAAADAGLAVGRVALLRAGARLSVATGPDERVVYALELELAR